MFCIARKFLMEISIWFVKKKIEKCNSMVFEDYSLSKNPIIKEKEEPKQDEDDDFGMVALTYYHF